MRHELVTTLSLLKRSLGGRYGLPDQKQKEDAEEYVGFNVVGAWVGEGTPIFVELAPK
jgi:hypothetical protein